MREVTEKISTFERAVVTGGAGFLGSHLCERLVGLGTEVVCVDNLVTGRKENIAGLLESPKFTFLEQDVVQGLAVSGRVDLVVHGASPASPKDYHSLPIETLRAGSEGTVNALELALAKDARFLLMSTSEVYGDPAEHPQPESYHGNVNPVGPRSSYDEAKRFAEAMTMAYRRHRDVDTAVARIFNSYGPLLRPDDGRVIPTFIHQALTGRAITIAGDGLQTRSFCYVADMVDGLLALASSRSAGPVNIGNPVEITILEIADKIRQLCGSASPLEFVPLPDEDPRVRCPDIRLAEAELAWHPSTDLDTGLRKTIAWMTTVTVDEPCRI